VDLPRRVPVSAPAVVQLPRPLSIARHAVPHLVEATLVPAALFLLVLHLGGLTLAALVAVAWGYVALGRRVVRRQRVPAMLILSSVGLTVRTIVVIINGSAFLYFLQPVIVAAVIGLIFLLSALTPRPLVHRLAGDFCPLPPGVAERIGVRRLFLGLTLFWALVNLGNAAFTFWLLVSQSTAVFVAIRGVTGTVVTATGVAITVAWSWRVARLEGLRGPTRRLA
jgi:intracellular septation protein A